MSAQVGKLKSKIEHIRQHIAELMEALEMKRQNGTRQLLRWTFKGWSLNLAPRAMTILALAGLVVAGAALVFAPGYADSVVNTLDQGVSYVEPKQTERPALSSMRRPFTSEEQLLIQAEMEDFMSSPVRLSRPFTAEEQLLIQAEVDDGMTYPVVAESISPEDDPYAYLTLKEFNEMMIHHSVVQPENAVLPEDDPYAQLNLKDFAQVIERENKSGSAWTR